MTIEIELITPERLVFKDQVDMVVAPTPKGELGVLTNHAPLLTQLEAGEIRLKKGDVTRFVAVSGGFLEVQHGGVVSIFAETAEFAELIDVERARLAVERAKTKLGQQADLTSVELAQVEASLSRNIMRMKIGQSRWRKIPPNTRNN